MVVALHHVSLLIADLQRSQQFYEQVLGLSQIERPNLQFDGLWFALNEDQSQQLHLLLIPDNITARELPSHVGRDGHFALLVDDLPAHIDRAERAGITYTMSRSGREAAFLRDPDGNGIELIAI